MRNLKQYRISHPRLRDLFQSAREARVSVHYIDLGITADMATFFQKYTEESLVEYVNTISRMQLRRPQVVDSTSVKRIALGGAGIAFAYNQFFHFGQVVIGAYCPPHSPIYIYALRLSEEVQLPQPPKKEVNGRKMRTVNFHSLEECLTKESEIELRALARDVNFSEHARVSGQKLPEQLAYFLEPEYKSALKALYRMFGKEYSEIRKEFPDYHISVTVQQDGTALLSLRVGVFEVQGKCDESERLLTDALDTVTQAAIIFNGWTLLEYHTKK
ncbi:MAG: hypothetical protein ACRCZZ_05460 [Phocaeicola sp.]